MPFNGSGSFVPLPAPDFPAVAGTTIVADYYNNTLNDLFNGLSNVVTRDGQSPATANLPMGGFKLTNVGAPTVANDVLTWGNAAQVSIMSIISTGAPAQVIARAPSGQFARLAIASDGRDSSSQGVHVTQAVDGTGGLATIGGHNLILSTNSTERVRISPTGAVGIGTASPVAKLTVSGDTSTTGTFFSYSAEGLRIIGDGAYTSFWDTAGTTRTGFLRFTPGADVALAAENANLIRLSHGGKSITYSSAGLIPNTNGDQVLGTNSTRWGTFYGTFGNFTNGVSKLAQLPPNGSGLVAGEVFLAPGNVNFPAKSAGEVFYVFNSTAGNITLTTDPGITLVLAGTSATGNRTLLSNGFVQAWYLNTNLIILTGSGLT